MTVQFQEFSVWCRVTYSVYNPGRRIGPFTFGERHTEKMVEVVRVYPKTLDLDDNVSCEKMADQLLGQGYKPLDAEVLAELVESGVRSRRHGYVVAPLKTGGFGYLMNPDGQLRHLDHCLYVGTVENTGYSMIVAR